MVVLTISQPIPAAEEHVLELGQSQIQLRYFETSLECVTKSQHPLSSDPIDKDPIDKVLQESVMVRF